MIMPRWKTPITRSTYQILVYQKQKRRYTQSSKTKSASTLNHISMYILIKVWLMSSGSYHWTRKDWTRQ